jgi:hypothetical protein
MESNSGKTLSRAMGFDLPHSALLVQPSLKHENIPELIVPVACACEMIAPLFTYGIGIEDALLPQPLFVQKGLCPLLQGLA